MNKMLGYVGRLPCLLKTTVCLLLCLLFGFMDYITGDYSVSVFYFLPIALASWFIGKRAGVIISIVCCVELVLNDLLGPGNIITSNVKLWNALMEVCFIIFSGYVISTLKVEMDKSSRKSIALQAANKELETFDYTVAHDLRQPLNLLSSYCQVIDKLFGDQLPEECKGYLRDAYNTTVRMNHLIEALLTFSRMGQVELRRESVDLSMLAQEVALSRKLAEPEREVDFRIADGITANGEMNLLRVVLDNLIGNAWKYTSMREKAVIEFGVRNINSVPTYFVRDNGTGFDMSDADKLFTAFQRLPDAEKYRGFGIGLATVERIIRRHGGKVWAEGEPGKGACIYFTLSGDN